MQIDQPTIDDFTNANHDHSNAANGGTIAFSDITGTVDISDQTNLAVSSPITLTGDTVGFDLTADLTITGNYNFGGATNLEIPNSATPTVNTDGQVAVDTTVTDFSAGVLKYYSGEEMGVVAMPIAQFSSPTNGHVVSYNATNDEFELVAQSGGSSAQSFAYAWFIS